MKIPIKIYIIFCSILILILALLLNVRSLDNANKNLRVETTPDSRLITPTGLLDSVTINPTIDPTFSRTNSAIGITFEEDQQIAPFSPRVTDLIVLPDQSVKLKWHNTSSTAISHFNVYRKSDFSDWEIVGQIKSNSEQNEFVYVHKQIQGSEKALYAITSVDVYGNESHFSDSVAVPVNKN